MALRCTCPSLLMSPLLYGNHAWMQYSRRGLTMDLYNVSSIYEFRQVMVFLIIPKIELVLADALVTCLEGFESLIIRTPRSFSSSVDFSAVYPRKYS